MNLYRKKKNGKATGPWRVDYTDPHTGKRVRKSTGLTSKQAALIWMGNLQRELELKSVGVNTHAETMRAKPDDLITKYERSMEDNRRASRHIDGQIRAVRFMLEGAATMADVSLRTLERRKAKLKDKSVRTQRFYVAAARTFFRWLIDADRWDASKNYAARLSLPKGGGQASRRRWPPTPAELDAICEAAPRDRANVYRFAAETGLRHGELRGLTWGDVDLDAATFTVRASVAKNRTTTTLPLSDEALGVLQGIHALMLDAWNGHSPCDVEPQRTIFRVPDVRAWKRDLEAAEVEYHQEPNLYRDFHSLRAYFCTQHAMGGMAPALLQRLARHSRIELTMNFYTHLRIDDLAAALRASKAASVARASRSGRRKMA